MKVAVYLVFCGVVLGQTFDVASVRRSPPFESGMPNGLRVDSTHFISEQYPIRTLIIGAYQIESWALIGAPDWTRDEGYDVKATMPTGTTNERLEAMVRNLLVDRCKLTVHRETKEALVYALVIARGGPKLKVTAEDTKYGVQRRVGHLEMRRTGMVNFLRTLPEPSDRPILDRTGIQGQFDITLDWTPETRPGADGPSVFTAIEEQLGLKLESRKEAIEYLVIDHIERPSEN